MVNDLMRGRRRPLCASLRFKPVYEGVRPFVYPIFNIYPSGRPEGLCAETHNNCHTFGRTEAKRGLYAPHSLLTEPRASSCLPAPLQRSTSSRQCSMVYPGWDGVYPGWVGSVYPGWVGGVYPGWVGSTLRRGLSFCPKPKVKQA